MTLVNYTLDSFRRQIELAEERITLFESKQMRTYDIGPPERETTEKSIEAEKELIEALKLGIEILSRHTA